MRKLIVISGIILSLVVTCTGCGNKVNYVQGIDDESADEIDDKSAEISESGDSVSSGTEDLSGGLNEGSAEEQKETLAVYVCGAVKVPGVYYFETGDIKQFALEAAGGFLEGASADYVNLAEKLYDGERLYFPYEEEVEAGEIRYDSLSGASSEESSQQEQNQSTSSGKVNINTADKTELMTLPGIGESKAELIINYRESNGAFNSAEDIMNINGIKEGVYSKIKDYIVVE